MSSIPSAIEGSIGQVVDPTSRVRLPDNQPDTDRSASRQRVQSKTAEVSAAQQHLPPPPNRAVTFRRSEDAQRFYIEVVDRSTGEVIRQIPAEQLLKVAEQVGNLLNVSV